MAPRKQIAITYFAGSFIVFSVACALNYAYHILSFELSSLICLQSLMVIVITFIETRIGDDDISVSLITPHFFYLYLHVSS